MSTRLEPTKEYAQRYRQAEQKKEKTRILDEFLIAAGYRQRKYAVKLLRHFDTVKLALIAGRTVKPKSARAKRPGNRKGKPMYDEGAIAVLKKIWAFSWRKRVGYGVSAISGASDPGIHRPARGKQGA